MGRLGAVRWGATALLPLLFGLLAESAVGQTLSGRGPQASRVFDLPAGLVLFEVTHEGDRGAFLIRLLDEAGTEVDVLARGDGRFGGSKAIGIPADGRFLLDVAATGSWRVRIRSGVGILDDDSESPEVMAGREAGEDLAGGTSTGRWFGAGLAGGTLAGPIGAGVVAALAGRSAISDWPLPPAGESASFRQAFEEGYEVRVRERRRRTAIVGGLVGSAVFVGALIAAIEIAGEGGDPGDTDPPPVDLDRRLRLSIPLR